MKPAAVDLARMSRKVSHALAWLASPVEAHIPTPLAKFPKSSFTEWARAVGLILSAKYW